MYVVATKSFKVSLLSPLINITYIPLDNEQMVGAKSLVDSFSVYIGKNLCSWIQLMLIYLYGLQWTIYLFLPFLILNYIIWFIYNKKTFERYINKINYKINVDLI